MSTTGEYGEGRVELPELSEEDKANRVIRVNITLPWYEDLKPGTLVVDAKGSVFVAYTYKGDLVFDGNWNLIGKPAHLRLATATERSFLTCKE